MLRLIFRQLKRIDWILLTVSMVLFGLGLVTLFALAQNGAVTRTLFWKQVAYGIIGIIIALWLSSFNYRVLRAHGGVVLFCYTVVILGLAGLFLFGEVIRGTQAWYRIGGFSIAPVEFAKIALLVLLAKFFSDRHRDLYTVRHILLSFGYALVAILLVLGQPDVGSALVLAGIWFGVVLFSGIRTRYVAMLFLAVFLVGSLGWQYGLKPYQKERIKIFINPSQQARGFGYNTIQARVAIGSGGLFGKGFGAGSQGGKKFLPEASTDFIFSAFAEEQGLMGMLAIFSLFGIVWYRVLKIGFTVEHNFGRIYAFGFALLLVIHFFINVGMNIGILPVIGLPLPFLSYGGSHILASFLGLGILFSIAAGGKQAPSMNQEE